jgi:hypothetical protein
MAVVLGKARIMIHSVRPAAAIVDRFHVTRAVEVFIVETVAYWGPKVVVPTWTVRNVAGSLVPFAFVAVRVKV